MFDNLIANLSHTHCKPGHLVSKETLCNIHTLAKCKSTARLMYLIDLVVDHWFKCFTTIVSSIVKQK